MVVDRLWKLRQWPVRVEVVAVRFWVRLVRGLGSSFEGRESIVLMWGSYGWHRPG